MKIICANTITTKKYWIKINDKINKVVKVNKLGISQSSITESLEIT